MYTILILMEQEFKEAHKVKAELTLFKREKEPISNKIFKPVEVYFNLKIIDGDNVAVDINMIPNSIIENSKEPISLESLIHFLIKSPYTKANFSVPKSLFEKQAE